MSINDMNIDIRTMSSGIDENCNCMSDIDHSGNIKSKFESSLGKVTSTLHRTFACRSQLV